LSINLSLSLSLSLHATPYRSAIERLLELFLIPDLNTPAPRLLNLAPGTRSGHEDVGGPADSRRFYFYSQKSMP